MAAPRGINIAALSARWHELKTADKDDTEAQAELRKIQAQLRKVDHGQLHPNERMVEIDVPEHPLSTDTAKIYFTIGNAVGQRFYHGKCVVPQCVAHELLYQIAAARGTEQRRMTSHTVKIREDGRIQELARQIAT